MRFQSTFTQTRALLGEGVCHKTPTTPLSLSRVDLPVIYFHVRKSPSTLDLSSSHPSDTLHTISHLLSSPRTTSPVPKKISPKTTPRSELSCVALEIPRTRNILFISESFPPPSISPHLIHQMPFTWSPISYVKPELMPRTDLPVVSRSIGAAAGPG